MKIIRNILLIAVALLLQSSFFGRFDIYGIRPDLAMLVLIIIVNFSRPVECILYGFLIGFLQDVYSPEYLGFNSLTMSFMGFLMSFVRERITVEQGIVYSMVTFFACLVHDGLYLTMYTHFNYSILGNLFLKVSLPGAVYTTALSMIFFIVKDWIGKGGISFVFRQFMEFRR